MCIRDSDQCRVVIDHLARHGKGFSAAEVAVAVPDQQLTPLLVRSLNSANAGAHDSTGSSLNDGAVIRFLKLATLWLDQQRYSHFSELVRHEFVYQYVDDQVEGADWLVQVDRFNDNNLLFHVGPRSDTGTSVLSHVISAVSLSLIHISEPTRPY